MEPFTWIRSVTNATQLTHVSLQLRLGASPELGWASVSEARETAPQMGTRKATGPWAGRVEVRPLGRTCSPESWVRDSEGVGEPLFRRVFWGLPSSRLSAWTQPGLSQDPKGWRTLSGKQIQAAARSWEADPGTGLGGSRHELDHSL